MCAHPVEILLIILVHKHRLEIVLPDSRRLERHAHPHATYSGNVTTLSCVAGLALALNVEKGKLKHLGGDGSIGAGRERHRKVQRDVRQVLECEIPVVHPAWDAARKHNLGFLEDQDRAADLRGKVNRRDPRRIFGRRRHPLALTPLLRGRCQYILEPGWLRRARRPTGRGRAKSQNGLEHGRVLRAALPLELLDGRLRAEKKARSTSRDCLSPREFNGQGNRLQILGASLGCPPLGCGIWNR